MSDAAAPGNIGTGVASACAGPLVDTITPSTLVSSPMQVATDPVPLAEDPGRPDAAVLVGTRDSSPDPLPSPNPPLRPRTD